jgi:predicted phosphodiesterase
MIYLFGDLHGIEHIEERFNEENFKDGSKLTKKDYVIVLGDFGIPWGIKGSLRYFMEYGDLDKLSKKPWTTLFIDGNHENFENLNSAPVTDMFGGKVGVIAKDIYHLKRGYIYTIEDKTFFAFGGAVSIDKAYRTEGVSWWKEEIPSKAEYNRALNNLEKVNYEVDYVLTHTHDYKVSTKLLHKERKYIIQDDNSQFFESLENKIKFKKWFFGHFHCEWVNYTNTYYCLYYWHIKLNTKTNKVKIFRRG